MLPARHTLQVSCPPRESGFSLIIVSILITVAAILLVAMLPGGGAGDYNQKTISNVDKLQKVEEAMRGFMAFNGRRPCPADGQYNTGNANFGKEAATPGACTGGTPAAPMGPDSVTGEIIAGTIPVRSLGLPDDYAFDSYGRPFTYTVDKRATDTQSCLTLEGITSSNPIPTGKGDLIIEDGSHTPIDNTMVAYISHGPSGYGAFPPQGSTVANRINSGSTDADMQTNAGVNSSFTYSTTSFTNTRIKKDRVRPTSVDTGFDDLLWYRNDIKNTCCLGTACAVSGSVVNGYGNYMEVGGSVFTNAKGDVNGDGIPDLILIALDANGGGTTAIKVFVIFGTKSGFPDPLPLNSLNGINGFEIDPPAVATGGDYSVLADDVNGDGFADIAIAQSSGAGSVYVVFGGKTGTNNSTGTAWTSCPCSLSTAFLNGSNGVEFDGAAAPDHAGKSIAAADVNGDGIADLIIGAYIADNWQGSVYVVFGKKTGWPNTATALNAALLDGVNGAEFDGPQNPNSVDEAGAYVTTGDVNGDGIADFLIDAPGGQPSSLLSAAGSVYVVFGKKTGWSGTATTLDSTFLNGTNGAEFDGTVANEEVGNPIATGDFNGDGNSDIFINAPIAAGGANDQIKFYIVFGKKTGWSGTASALNSAFLNGANGVEFDGPTYSMYTPQSVASGDVNGDGIADLILGAPSSPNGLTVAGSVYVLFGKKTGWSGTPTNIDSSFLNGINGSEFDGASSGDYAGVSVAAGDVSGDGIDDLVIGACCTSTGSYYRSGSTYVYFGKKKNWPATPYSLGGL